jgi:glycosidase
MIDAVFNHVGRNFPQWLDVIEHQEDSIYKDWFIIHKFPVPKYDTYDIDKYNLEYASFAFSPFMPKLNTRNPEVRAFLLDIATFWIKEFDIDGWRLDVANEIDHSFWREFRTEIKSIKEDCLILGEIWHDPLPWLDGSQWDSVMNYPLTDAINKFFADQEVNAKEFVYQVNKVATNLPVNFNQLAFNLLDSHDTKRILSRAPSKEQAMMAYLFQFSQPGAPCIYYGGEIGLYGEDDPDNRRAMPWDESEHDMSFKAFIQKIIALRKHYPAFKKAPQFIYFEGNQLVYKKDDLYFIFNNDQASSIYHDELDGRFTNLLDDKIYNLSKGIELSTHQFLVLEREENDKGAK